MFRYSAALGSILALVSNFVGVHAAPFTPGNVVIYRVGDGQANLTNTGAKVFLDEYTPTGTLVQSFAIPFTGNNKLIASGTAASEGLLTQSLDGRYLLLTGYDRELGGGGDISGTGASTVPRVIARVEVETGTYERTNALTDFASTSNPRSVTSDNGERFWVGGGSGGVRYVASVGQTTSTQVSTTITNVRQVNIFDGQLYVSAGATIQMGKVGNGLPTSSGNQITSLNGFSASGSTYGYFFADLNPNVPGVDTLYVADDGNVRGGITKWTLVNDVWLPGNTIGQDADDYRGLTGYVEGTTVVLFATRKGGTGANGGGELVKLVDTSGYNGTFSGEPTLLATAATRTAFRGVVYLNAIPEPNALALSMVLIGLGGVYGIRRWNRGADGIRD